MNAIKEFVNTAGAWILDHKKFSGAVLLVVIGVVVGKLL